MRQRHRGFYVALLLLFLSLPNEASAASDMPVSDDLPRIFATGRLLDQQGRPVAATSLFTLFIFNRFYRGRIYRKVDGNQIDSILKDLHEKSRITDKVLLGFGSFILSFVIFLFMSHQY